MVSFSNIVGQEAIKKHMKNALSTRNISHAYILSGEKNAGKKFIANIFAMAIQCEKSGAEPCGICHSCKQAISNNNPDIIMVSHEKPNSISVEDIRNQVNNDIIIKPYSSDYKIYIINECEKMTPQAQNALLKTLEEPPQYAILFLLTTNVQLLLPTITSRCVVLSLKAVSDKQITKYIMEELQLPDYKAKICAAFARGNVGRAKYLATNEDFEIIREEAVTLLRNIKDMEINEVVTAIKKITEYHMDVNDYLDILAVWYRDVLLFKATKDANTLIFKDEIQYIKKGAQLSDYEGLEKILNALQKTQTRLKANVNFDLAMELLLLTIKEN